MTPDLQGLRAHLLARLERYLPATLYYHGLHHTLDVEAAALRLCDAEDLQGAYRELVHVAALYHDSGFLIQYFRNESAGALLAQEDMPSFGYSKGDVERVKELILATRFPQQPQDYLEELLCDADLDYLGREDFFHTAHALKRELHCYGVTMSLLDWYKLQIRFLNEHYYFTASARAQRQAPKEHHLRQIEDLLQVGGHQ